MKNIILSIVVAAFFALEAGCVTVKEWAATGGSRSDGIVVLSYTHGNFESPQSDLAQGAMIAEERCKSWGYQGAQAFGGEIKRCTMPAPGGCNYWQVDRQFQCTGQPDK